MSTTGDQKSLLPAENPYESTLPLFELKPSEDFPGWVLVTCPRESCPSEKPFLVHKQTWLAPRVVPAPPSLKARGVNEVTIYGRCCPYCHAVSRPPKGRRKRQ